eukprot:CAMPEP_0118993936 /NCGR_PEP_ID=MMETSP1173-20130426/55968_1 /TAXON_ID=1034831 /ORGANISM="Rhizochromulina marina cf, Strain CCMP1243" /LENGTH=199 /DNA_ID=CAMNT_0006945195 /DNA_START=33 /DNA_END=628 /DNA_ORIENTATION=+
MKKKLFFRPQRVSTLDSFGVTSLASGDFHMLALTRDRRVFAWGYGAEGQCGQGNSLHLRTPRPVEALRHVLVSKISCGAWHSAALSADGYLYTWGYGDGGWLGQPRNKAPLVEPGPPTVKHGETCSFDSGLNHFLPNLVNDLSDIQVTSVTCGGAHTVMLAIARDALTAPKKDLQELRDSAMSALAAAHASPAGPVAAP